MTGCGVLREGEVGCGVDQGKKLYINIFLFSPGTLFTVLLSLPETVPRFPKFANTLSFINFTFSRDVFFLPSLPTLFDFWWGLFGASALTLVSVDPIPGRGGAGQQTPGSLYPPTYLLSPLPVVVSVPLCSVAASTLPLPSSARHE